jgi:hypothetical protein
MSRPSSIPTPYPLTETAQGYAFTTDAGEAYVLYYSPAVDYFPGLVVGKYAAMFGFMRLAAEGLGTDDDTTPEYDPRIKPIILRELAHFFHDERRVLTFVCQDGQRQRAAYRHRLFGRWFREANDRHFIRHVVSEANGLYAILIYRDTNPFAEELQHELPTLEDKLNHMLGQNPE